MATSKPFRLYDSCSGRNVAYTLPVCKPYMIHPDAQFLWLDPVKYPDFQRTPETVFVPSSPKTFCAVEFTNTVTFPTGKNPVAHVCLFADTKFRLYINGEFIGIGPVAAGGDYGNTKPMPYQYYNRYDIPLDPNDMELTFLVQVHTNGVVMTDYSCGRGGFILSCEVTYDDRDSVTEVSYDKWRVRVNPRWKSVTEYDETVPLPDWETPYVIDRKDAPWELAFADIPMLAEDVIEPLEMTREVRNGIAYYRFIFDKIYSAYISTEIVKPDDSPLSVKLYADELHVDFDGDPAERLTVVSSTTDYRGMRMWSIGETACAVPIVDGEYVPDIKMKLIYAHYPYDPDNLGSFRCSDEMLNRIYSVGRHTLEMCRQTLHLDSPLHQETLGCTGDYAIESVMTHMTYGDMRLSRLDILRTADYLVMTDGYMFHTSYSLIWVQMVMDYYRYTGDESVLGECISALYHLFRRFHRCLNEDGIIDSPLNYMFIDWANVDGFNMHHPPKSLGQTALNAFYRQALLDAAEWCDIIGYPNSYRKEAEKHKEAFNRTFYDVEKGLYFDGLTDEYEPNQWLPENTKRRYYSRHSNTLAVLYGFIEGNEARALMERVVTEESLDGGATCIDVQPYFMHYVMEAINKVGLFEKHGLRLLHMWDKQVEKSPKGMKEGWNEFRGDHSHAWGATPTYQLPARLLGFEMLEPGFGCFALKPQLYGLKWAEIAMPTPYGLITCTMRNGKTMVAVPKEFKEVAADTGVYVFKK